MKDVVTPAPPEEVCKVVKKCLEGAALVNYTKLSDFAEVEGNYSGLTSITVSKTFNKGQTWSGDS